MPDLNGKVSVASHLLPHDVLEQLIVSCTKPDHLGGKFGDSPRICDKCWDLSLEILAETPPA